MIFIVDHRKNALPVSSNAMFNLHDVKSDDPYRSDNAYAEMRAHYAVWKDRTDLTWVGFEHYRRRLILPDHPTKLIDSYDIITTKPMVQNIRQQYIGAHDEKTWEIFEKVLQDVGYPWGNNSAFHLGNLYLLRWPLFDAYMTLWHQVMERLSKIIHPERDTYQERVYGFLSERLWSLWYGDVKSGLKILEVDYLVDDKI